MKKNMEEITVFPVISAPGHKCCLTNFEALIALDRGRGLFQSKKSYSYEISSLCHFIFLINKKC